MTIYGECETLGQKLAVQISNLAETGCHLASSTGVPLIDGDLLLWIGAVGPLAVTTMITDKTHSQAAFKEPLDPRILDHFLAG